MQDVTETLYARGITDGLPVVPPTREAVTAMLEWGNYDPEAEVGPIPPSNTIATVQDIAVNAVMAGCRPEYLPVVLAVVRAMLADSFTLYGIACSTKGCAPLIIVNGPVRAEIGLNTGVNVFGPGVRANATVGRAVRLILLNLGSARPGVLDKATLGHPGKFSYCIGEDEENSPWEPLHVARGLAPGTSAVTVFGCEAPRVVNVQQGSAEALLFAVAQTLACVGIHPDPEPGHRSQHVVVFAKEHRDILKAEGFTRRRIQEYVQAHAVIPAAHYRRMGVAEATDFAVLADPADLLVVAAGGSAGRFAAVIPAWAWMSRAVTEPVAG